MKRLGGATGARATGSGATRELALEAEGRYPSIAEKLSVSLSDSVGVMIPGAGERRRDSSMNSPGAVEAMAEDWLRKV